MAAEFNVVPADFDIYKTGSYDDNALVQAEPRDAYKRLVNQGWKPMRYAKWHSREPIYTFWDFCRNRWQRDAGVRIGRATFLQYVAAGPEEARGRPGAVIGVPAAPCCTMARPSSKYARDRIDVPVLV
ncbi:MAG: hypothetical protein ABIN37_15910, partial [Burkholderiaceae bacterium]